MNQKERREAKIKEVRKVLMNTYLDAVRNQDWKNSCLTMKELAEMTDIPYGSISSLIEHKDCWPIAVITEKLIAIHDKNYGGVRGYRKVKAATINKDELAREIMRLEQEQMDEDQAASERATHP